MLGEPKDPGLLCPPMILFFRGKSSCQDQIFLRDATGGRSLCGVGATSRRLRLAGSGAPVEKDLSDLFEEKNRKVGAPVGN